MVEIAQCRNVRISGVTLKNSPGWTLRPIDCEGVVIDGIRVRNPYYGRNTDGMDITASREVFVSNCDILGGDDGICLKSENYYGDTVPVSKNITITNCVVASASNGFKMGTATRGAFENITFSNSVVYADNGSPMMNRPIGGINVEMVDGGSVDGVVISNIRIQNARAPIFVRLGQRTKGENTFLRNVLIEGVDSIGTIVTSSITGVPGLRPTDITISDCRIRTVAAGPADWAHRDIPEVADQYPESWMMGRLPAFGFYIRHADRVRLRNIEVIADKPDARPAIVCDDVNDVIFAGLELSAPTGGAPVFDLRNTRRRLLHRHARPSRQLRLRSGQRSGLFRYPPLRRFSGASPAAVNYANGASRVNSPPLPDRRACNRDALNASARLSAKQAFGITYSSALRTGFETPARKRAASGMVALDERQYFEAGNQARPRLDALHRYWRL